MLALLCCLHALPLLAAAPPHATVTAEAGEESVEGETSQEQEAEHSQVRGKLQHTAAQTTQLANRQINSLPMTLLSCYLLSIDDNFPIETRHSKGLPLKPMHSRLKINI